MTLAILAAIFQRWILVGLLTNGLFVCFHRSSFFGYKPGCRTRSSARLSACLSGVRRLNTRLTTTGLAWLEQLKNYAHTHPKRLAGLLASVLLSTGGGAFAVANIGPDPAQLPVSTITEAVNSLAADTPLSALTDSLSYSLYRSDITRSSDTAETLLRRLGVADPAAANFLRNDPNTYHNLLGRTGRNVSAETSDSHRLQRLTARWAQDDSGNFQRLVVERVDDGSFASRIETAPLTLNTRLAGGVIESSLFSATDASNIPDAVAVQMAEMFSTHIDFRRSLRKGDRFAVVYQTLEADGEPLRSGKVLSAEFHNGNKSYDAVWFESVSGKGAYYGLDGKSLQRAYLSSPVAFSRVSSGFAMRLHPIHKTWRAHLGTDFAAPTGTAVRTVGDGVVEFAGVQSGYGNVVHINHGNEHVTVYAHLSRIDVRAGQRIEQGHNIGAVGATGWATGPHLHFEFRVKGVHQDPMVIAQASAAAQPVTAATQAVFQRMAGQMREQLQTALAVKQINID